MKDRLEGQPRLGGKDWFPPKGRALGTAFYVRRDLPWLKHYLDLDELHSTVSPDIVGTFAWGGRIGPKIVKAIGRVRGLPHWHLEDGFLRSVALGKAGSMPLSIVADDLGLSVDASRETRLERLIVQADAAAEEKGAAIRDAIVRHRLSKYNHLPHLSPDIPTGNGRRRLLLIDQVVGDVSVGYSMGSAASFEQMLDDAVASGAQCIVRSHPDVIAGYRKGYMTEAASKRPGVIVFADPVSVDSVLSVADEVWTVASQFGFDALLRNIPVRCYAAPFYSGWGLTEDRMSSSARRIIAGRRTIRRSVDHLAVAGFLHYPLYRDPSTWAEIDVFRAIDLILEGQAGQNR